MRIYILISAQLLLKLNRFEDAEQVYQELVKENPDCYAYFEGWQAAKQIKPGV
jgi:pentatricopeptide repeat protein